MHEFEPSLRAQMLLMFYSFSWLKPLFFLRPNSTNKEMEWSEGSSLSWDLSRFSVLKAVGINFLLRSYQELLWSFHRSVRTSLAWRLILLSSPSSSWLVIPWHIPTSQRKAFISMYIVNWIRQLIDDVNPYPHSNVFLVIYSHDFVVERKHSFQM